MVWFDFCLILGFGGVVVYRGLVVWIWFGGVWHFGFPVGLSLMWGWCNIVCCVVGCAGVVGVCFWNVMVIAGCICRLLAWFWV